MATLFGGDADRRPELVCEFYHRQRPGVAIGNTHPNCHVHGALSALRWFLDALSGLKYRCAVAERLLVTDSWPQGKVDGY
jgi:hypothetical protein